MFCNSCGVAIPDGAPGCAKCGEGDRVKKRRNSCDDVGAREAARGVSAFLDPVPAVSREVARRVAFHGGLLATATVVAWPGGSVAVAAGLAVAAVIAYVVIPWPPRGPGVLTFSRGSAVVGPDILGLVLTGLFYVLPILVIADHARPFGVGSLFDIEDGWIWLTAGMWFLAAISATIIVAALWYATFAVHLVPGGLVRFNLLGRAEWRWTDTVRAEPAHFEFPRWVRISARIVAVLNWRVAGAVILGAESTMNGLRLVARDGRTLTLWADHMPEFPRIIEAMTAAGVPLDLPAIRESQPGWLGEEPKDEEGAEEG